MIMCTVETFILTAFLIKLSWHFSQFVDLVCLLHSIFIANDVLEVMALDLSQTLWNSYKRTQILWNEYSKIVNVTL